VDDVVERVMVGVVMGTAGIGALRIQLAVSLASRPML
jgi:hypothetical protein